MRESVAAQCRLVLARARARGVCLRDGARQHRPASTTVVAVREQHDASGGCAVALGQREIHAHHRRNVRGDARAYVPYRPIESIAVGECGDGCAKLGSRRDQVFRSGGAVVRAERASGLQVYEGCHGMPPSSAKLGRCGSGEEQLIYLFARGGEEHPRGATRPARHVIDTLTECATSHADGFDAPHGHVE